MKIENQVVSLEIAKKLKDIPGYKGLYAVSDDGSVFSCRRGKYLSIHIKKGYETVSLYKNGSLKTHLVHRLVAKTFLKPVSGKTDVNHKDGNKLNNYLWNLEWCNDSENQVHARKLGLQGGERSNTAKLTVKEVKEIRKAKSEGATQRGLAYIYGVNEQTISKIINYKTWKYV